jgi:hypothetical protein
MQFMKCVCWEQPQTHSFLVHLVCRCSL